jgi:hypothetical protein
MPRLTEIQAKFMILLNKDLLLIKGDIASIVFNINTCEELFCYNY